MSVATSPAKRRTPRKHPGSPAGFKQTPTAFVTAAVKFDADEAVAALVSDERRATSPSLAARVARGDAVISPDGAGAGETQAAIGMAEASCPGRPPAWLALRITARPHRPSMEI